MQTQHMPSPLHPQPLQHPLLPRFQMRKVLDNDPRPASSRDPTPVRDICCCTFIAYEIFGGGGREVFVLVRSGGDGWFAPR